MAVPTHAAWVTLTSSPLPVVVGDPWRYFKGTTAPPSSWKTVGFNDTSWLEGPGGLGYGPDCTVQRGTVLTDMQNPPASVGYLSVFTRHAFSVADPSAIDHLDLAVDYDDGFVAYLNGTEVARSASMGGTPGTPPAFDATAASRECSSCDGGSCNPGQTFTVSAGLLLAGENVLAIEGHNRSLDSTDFTLIATLQAAEPPNPPPTSPTSPDSPASGASGVPQTPTLCVTVHDPDNDPMTVRFFGRQAGSAPDQDFTIIALPDTQFYAQNYPDIFTSQTQWIKDNRVARNIVFVTQLGDCVNDGDTAGQEYQWTNADAAFNILEGALSSELPNGIPYGIAVGNHDNAATARSGSDEGGSTVQYTKMFGLQRSCPGLCSNNTSRSCHKDSECVSPGICNPGSTCRSYFGGRYDFGDPSRYFRNSDNHYELFSASGMDFIIFHLEWDNPDDASPANNPTRTAVLNWVHGLLDPVTGLYRNRRAIVTTHYFLASSGSFSGQGQHIYNALRDLPNVFLLLAGHRSQAVDRADPATDGHTIYTLMSDYQTMPNGGDGWLRIMTFSPQSDTIHVETFSPWIEGGRFINKPTRHADDQPTNPGGNELTLAYNMNSGLPWESLGAVSDVQSDGTACVSWPHLLPAGTEHEWYVTVDDGASSVRSSTWTFTTTQTCSANVDCDDQNGCNGLESCQGNTCVSGTPLTCNDSDPCTDDSCNPFSGCVFTQDDTNSCSDGNACNGLETCVAGDCTNGPSPNCDDGNSCTDDSCVQSSGCRHTNITATCDDGSACTTSDSCSGGRCRGTYQPFSGCCSDNGDCDDGNRSTTDACSGGDCSNVPNANCLDSSECDDGNACTADACATENVAALDFDGVDDYVSMGAAPGLNASPQFTIETWFKWDGGGAATSTGSGGITAIPLVSKGRAEQETPANVNMNYFLGIFLSGGFGRLGGDFEDAATGLNHPVCAALTSPAISTGVWHHAALAYDYDGTAGSWRLVMDGQELPTDTSCSTCVGAACTTTPAAVPEPNSIQRFALGTGLLSAATDTPAGYLEGKLDEVRVWRVARTLAQIHAGKDLQITSDPDLLGRWGLNEGSAKVAGDSDPDGDGTVYNGALKPDSPSGNVPAWVTGGGNLPGLGIGICQHAPLDCNDGDDCTADFCSAGVCGHTPAANGTQCGDQNACTTNDRCSGGRCRGTYSPSAGCCLLAADCDDGVPSTTDACSANNCSNALSSCNTAADCSDFRACTTDTCTGGNPTALDFDGTNDYVSAGAAPGLNASPKFTVETWFRWDGGGLTTSTGTGGITAIPLVTKGRAEAETPANKNTNYFLGIYLNGANGRLAGDFEDAATGLNHPVCASLSTPAITTGVWHHAAIVYDNLPTVGWRVHLDGAALTIEADADGNGTACSTCVSPNCTTTPGVVPEPNSVQRFALGSALRSESAPEQPLGFFDGRLDEVRVWKVARTAAEIQAGMNQQITSNTNLIGRWGLNEGTGPTALDSDPNGDGTFSNGTLLPSYPSNSPVWVPSGGSLSNLATGTCSRALIPGCCATDDDCVDTDRCTTDNCVGANPSGLDFDGTDDYVSMGAAAGLNASPRFTIETWFNWNGGGVAQGTGTGGITAIPLVTKGRNQDEVPANVNMNYFLGITTNGRLAADFEDAATGLNHPVCAAPTTPVITTGAWHHAAAVYDFNTTTGIGSWSLDLDGTALAIDTACSTCVSPNCTTTPPAVPEPNSIQRFALGTALQSFVPEVPGGYFAGKLDEVRVWNVARTLAQIQAGKNVQIASDPNLLGRWGLNEGSGPTALDSDPNGNGTSHDGTLLPSHPTNAPAWIPGGGDLPPLGSGSCTHTLSGLCCATSAECNDGNPCTDDACVNGTCTHPNNFNPCDDGSACTLNDRCSGGACIGGAAPNCDDGNLCTDDSCIPSSGCAHSNNTAPCDDGNACTTNDRCSAGTCRGGAAANCDDDNVCTTDSCAPSSGCGHAPRSGSCNDGNACTTNDACSAGICGGATLNCDDGIVCTTDSCNPASGCGHVNNTAPCSDGNACTTNDTCSAGTCRGGAAPNCDDGIVCTTDSCNTSIGCIHSNNTVACSDGNACTTNDRCGGGACVGGATLNCDDGNVCTDDSCNPSSGCLHQNNSAPCSDGNQCTSPDTCVAAGCVGGPNVCACVSNAECNDNNPCTTDTCQNPGTPSSSCGHTNNVASCSDGNACTTNDTCSGGACVGGPAPNCDDGNVCTTDACSPSTGCGHVNNTAPCDDGNACTASDTCSGGACIGQPSCGGTTLERRVGASSDDAEEKTSGSVSLTSSDLELVHDSTDQKIGIRFTGLTIPRGALIRAAWIQFKTDEVQSETTTLTIEAQAIGNAPTFTTSRNDVSSRARTARSATWSPDPWTILKEVGAKQKTPDLSAVIQEVVNGSGWAPGNALVILIRGTGHRTGKSWNGDAPGAPSIHIEFSGGSGGGNQAPNGVIDTPTGNPTITAGQSVSFTGTGQDPDGNTPLTFLWNMGGGASNKTVEDPGTVTFSTAGNYTVTFTVRDSLGQADPTPDTRVVRVNSGGGGTTTLERRVSASSDDAELRGSSVNLTSSDLEMITDGSTNQTVGIRFTNITIPQGRTIQRAYIQFQTDETGSTTTNLTVQAQAGDDALTFTTSSSDFASRTRTESVAWNPVPAWDTVGQADVNQRTPEIKSLIQAVVSRQGWHSGNALVIIITGTGTRTAVAFDGTASGAPLLHVEY